MSRLRNFLVLSCLAFVLALFTPDRAQAQDGEVVIPASIVLSHPFPLRLGRGLMFGVAAIGSEGGTIMMPADSDQPVYDGSVSNMSTDTAHRGSFHFVGPTIGSYQMTFPMTAVVMTNEEDPSETIQLFPSLSVDNHTTTAENELVKVYVGGTVVFGANTAKGTYSADFTVGVNIP